MRVVVVGSGTVALTPDRVCAGYYVEAGGRRILLDCGPGTPHQLARFGLPWNRLSDVALSHFHTDHIGGLPLLLFALQHGLEDPRTEPLHIYGPAGLRERFDRLADAFGDYMREPRFPLELIELGGGDALALAAGVTLRAAPTPHTAASLAYRLEEGGAALGYTGDTGASDALGDFLAGVDLLIAECSLPDEQSLESHLTPRRVADLANRAEPRRLLVTHVYPQLARLDLPALIRSAGWHGALDLATDGMRLDVAS